MRRILRLDERTPCNLESDKREGLKSNASSLTLAKPDRFGPQWLALSLEQQDSIVEKLLSVESEDEIVNWLVQTHGLPEPSALAGSPRP